MLKAYRTFKSGMSNLIMGFNSTSVAKAAMDAMNIGSAAFEKYFNEDHHKEGSKHVQARYNHSKDHRIPLNDIARSEFANGVALLSNTVPNTFWLLYQLYLDPKLLKNAAGKYRPCWSLAKTQKANQQIPSTC